MKRLLLIAGILVASSGLIFSSAQAAYVVDGLVGTDWGINLAAASTAGYLDTHHPTSVTANWNSAPEDETDASHGWVQVNPGWSYQNKFDAEALYFDNDKTNGYIAVISGVRQAGWSVDGSPTFRPGDIGIDTNGDGIYEYGISITDKKLYPVTTWLGPYYTTAPNDFSAAAPWRIGTHGNALEDVDLVYSNDQNTHYVIETSFLLSDLNLKEGSTIDLHWAMECGNDAVNTRADVNGSPEPATMTLLGVGLAGLFLRRKKA